MTINRLDQLNQGTRLGLEADPYGPRGRSQGVTMQNTPAAPVGVGVNGPTDGGTPPPVSPPTMQPLPVGPPVGIGVNGPNLNPTPIGQPNTGSQMPTFGTGTNGASGLDAGRRVTADELVANHINELTSSNSRYMRNAAQRGLEYAGARGMLNSSIAAGAAQRSALEAALPIATADADAYRSANDQTYAALQSIRQMRVAGDIQNWLSSEQFNREYNGALAMMPMQSAMDMLVYTMQRGMEDPAVYTPDVLSGFNNFFNQSMFDIFGRYFGTGSTPGGG